MKKILLLALVSAALSTKAFAMAPYITELECNYTLGYADAGIVVQLDVNIQDPNASKIVNVYEDTIRGPVLLKTLPVKDHTHHNLGSPRVITGKQFRLVIKPTVTPVHGKMPAQLDAIINGQNYSLKMLCSYVR